eukprot:1386376-Pyramimonas_sp.AAC.1
MAARLPTPGCSGHPDALGQCRTATGRRWCLDSQLRSPPSPSRLFRCIQVGPATQPRVGISAHDVVAAPPKVHAHPCHNSAITCVAVMPILLIRRV